jgi:hypothetical protein
MIGVPGFSDASGTPHTNALREARPWVTLGVQTAHPETPNLLCQYSLGFPWDT